MSRPQIGIDRLPQRRMSNNEPRESMNCKSCRKRKIKCNRLRPCEACQVFACPCVYDAVPKKRGPKTDVLEALLKRVDGLEKRLHTEGKSDSPPEKEQEHIEDFNDPPKSAESVPQRPLLEIAPNPDQAPTILSPSDPSNSAQIPPTPGIHPGVLLDIYFARIHGKPYHIFDENTARQRIQSNQLPEHLTCAIYAISARYASQFGGFSASVETGLEYANRARMELDVEQPSIEGLQTLLLLTQAYFQMGKGKKAYMLLTSGISMAFALELHRELPQSIKIHSAEREGRRKLFWSCYLLDRFAACGSKRPSLITDESIVLRLPSWNIHPGSVLIQGDYFPNGSNLQYMGGPDTRNQGGAAMLIGIVRILGITNRYLAAGGVKGDSHFPWHSLSNLSKIRQELDIWISDTQETFASLETLFGQPDSTVLVLSKLIYHLIHCLIYRPFLPIDLTELAGTGQHQSWQIESTNLCFLHANAIAELVEIGKASASIPDWPAFVAYCICTAGTIHVHGAYYRGREGEVFSASAEFLAREMQQLMDLRFTWAGVQHQRDTLQKIYLCHSELVRALTANPVRFSPGFQLEDFFDRYPGQSFNAAHVIFFDVVTDPLLESPSYNVESRSNIYRGPNVSNIQTQAQPQTHPTSVPQQRPVKPLPSSDGTRKRRGTKTAQIAIPPTLKQFATTKALNRDVSEPLSGLSQQNSQPKQEHLSLSTSESHELSLPADFPALPPFSPNFALTGLDTDTVGQGDIGDTLVNVSSAYEQQGTPGAASASGSAHTEPDKDPFLSLLEQLAENEHSQGGPSELDFFLGGQT
ncbi:hypothetical protein M501DRAFT_1001754 [Patellaria atrata CBS 101060]|uniref:Zn(2)-C6 fungal-type domain-containing protein n=1 Tax=Patellaria atrata CBS 101060 TaxID=1346257 RepID=A0A9P4VSS4_9PEZI|nr:hypothetical protein M501DRAFT_1001754 [Patellaria atrata CBS 101060]